MQTTLDERIHVGLIMDGNGRWAARRGLPRPEGHKAGLEVVRRLAPAAPQYGVGALTLYAFSAENWRRPQAEVDALLGLMRGHLEAEAEAMARAGVRVEVIGRRDRLGAGLRAAITRAEAIGRTAGADPFRLRVAVDYSGRDEIAAAARAAGPAPTREAIDAALPGPPLDLVIRTAGEKRLSDFMLWRCAYAELHFTDVLWPDFTEADFAEAIADYRNRSRTFGALSPQSLASPAAAASG